MQQDAAATEIVKQHYSVRQAEKYIKRLLDQPATPLADLKQPAKDPNLTKLAASLGDHLQADVKLRTKKQGSGELVIGYHNLNQLDQILDRLGWHE